MSSTSCRRSMPRANHNRPMRKVPAKIVCLESYWDERLFQTFSVKGFLESMSPLLHPPLTVAHRFVDSHEGIAHYLRRPGGVMWRQRELFDAPIYYLAFHGRPAAVTPGLRRVPGEQLCEAFAGYGSGGYRHLVYFAARTRVPAKRGATVAPQFPQAPRA